VILSVFLFLPSRTAYCGSTVEYNIQLKNDGSSEWVLTQDLSSNGSFDNWQQFQTKVTSLVEKAQIATGRGMSVEVENMSISLSGSYYVIVYRFDWFNFSKTEDAKIVVGDVFLVAGFFNELYGDGGVNMTYPSGYIVETVSPQPYVRDDSRQSLIWVGTADFTNSTDIVLDKETSTAGLLGVLQENAVIIASLLMVVSGSLLVFFSFRYRQRRERDATLKPGIPSTVEMEGDEERIVKLVRQSGGSLYQSIITDRCGFSKAKTSQVLSILESKGVVHRHKKGRQKVVTLTDQSSKSQ